MVTSAARSLFVALVFALAFSEAVRCAPAVIVYGVGNYTEEELTVSLYADIPQIALRGFALRLYYDASELTVEAAEKNQGLWFLGNDIEKATYTNPDLSAEGEVLILGGRLLSGNTSAGATGNGVLLGTIAFTRNSPNIPVLSVSYGHDTADFANFVTTEHVVLDDESEGVVFNAISFNAAPEIAINNPAGSVTIPYTQDNYVFSGTATDSDGSVVAVQYRVNGGDWFGADGLVDWSFTVYDLIGGSNLIEIRARDDVGAYGPIASRVIVREEAIVITCQPGPLTLGSGTYTGTQVHRAGTALGTEEGVTFSSNANITLEAGESLIFGNRFIVEAGSTLVARITPVDCQTPSASQQAASIEQSLPRSATTGGIAVPTPQSLSFDELPLALWQQLQALGVSADDLTDIHACARGEEIVFATDRALVEDDKNALSDIYHYRTSEDVLWLLSRGWDGSPGNGASDQPRIDGWGDYVVYRSTADNLGQLADTNAVADIFLADLIYGLTERVSWTETWTETDTASAHPALGGEELFVVYDRANGSGQRNVYGYDTESGAAPESISLDETPTGELLDNHRPTISSDGRYVAYLEEAGGICRVHFYDRDSGHYQQPSCPEELAAASETATPQFSGDGSQVKWRISRTETVVVPNPLMERVPDVAR